MSAPLALTMGEPAGIGGEIALKAWSRRAEGIPPFFLIDDPERLRSLGRQIGWTGTFETIGRPEEADGIFGKAIPVLARPLPAEVIPGRANSANSASVIAAIETAVDLVRQGQASAMVTNPINKECLYQAGFAHPGHTEFLAALAGGVVPVMMLACPGLRVIPVTVHLSLKEAIPALTVEKIVTAGRIAAEGLGRDFAIAEPRLAVAGLNPHAGENGSLGREEIEIIRPAVEQLRALGIAASGPAPADTLFHAEARKRYDAALCMYHDQALIPLKTIDFDRGVNVTLGLPFIRTSPDHGTAFDIAGKGIASPESLIAALKLAGEMVERRASRSPA